MQASGRTGARRGRVGLVLKDCLFFGYDNSIVWSVRSGSSQMDCIGSGSQKSTGEGILHVRCNVPNAEKVCAETGRSTGMSLYRLRFLELSFSGVTRGTVGRRSLFGWNRLPNMTHPSPERGHEVGLCETAPENPRAELVIDNPLHFIVSGSHRARICNRVGARHYNGQATILLFSSRGVF